METPPVSVEDRLALGAMLTATGIALAPFAALVARRLVPGRRVFFARWGFTHLARLVLVWVLASLLVGLLWPLEGEGAPGLLETFARVGVGYAVALSYLALIVRRTEPNPAASLGLVAAGSPRAALLGVAVYSMLVPGLFGLTVLWPTLLELLGEPVAAQDVLLGFFELEGAALWLAAFLGVVVVPFIEELFFRGFLQPLLVQNFRDRGGVVLTSLAFGALHGQTAFLPIFALSLILGGVMLRTQRLAGAWAVHALHNGLMLALAFNVPELRELGGESLLHAPFSR